MPGPFPTDYLPLDQSAPLADQVRMLYDIVQALGLAVHLNAFNGLDRLPVLNAPPALTSLEEGQRVLAKDGVTWKLYARVQGALWSVALTAV